MAETSVNITDLLLADRLLLRVDEQDGVVSLRNWPTYQFAVQTLLRLRGAHSHIHLQSEGEPASLSEEWKMDEEICKGDGRVDLGVIVTSQHKTPFYEDIITKRS